MSEKNGLKTCVSTVYNHTCPHSLFSPLHAGFVNLYFSRYWNVTWLCLILYPLNSRSVFVERQTIFFSLCLDR